MNLQLEAIHEIPPVRLARGVLCRSDGRLWKPHTCSGFIYNSGFTRSSDFTFRFNFIYRCGDSIKQFPAAFTVHSHRKRCLLWFAASSLHGILDR